MDDELEIRQIVEDIERGLNTNDAALMTTHFRADATAVGANGAVVAGSADLLAAHERGVTSFLQDEYVSYRVDRIQFLDDRVALAWKSARARDAEGKLLEHEPSMRALYVLMKDQRWEIVARQNTLVAQQT